MQFPCFVETYGILNEINNTNVNIFIQNLLNEENNINYLSIDKTSYRDLINNFILSCEDATKYAIQIQHLSNLISFYDCFVEDSQQQYVDNIDFNTSVFQIICTLKYLANEFTHYDLHANNVLLYDFSKTNEYITIIYHLENDQIIQFPTRYLAKIIDYGRCFFVDTDCSSTKIIEEFNNKNMRKSECLSSIFDKNEFVTPASKNNTMDLQFLRNTHLNVPISNSNEIKSEKFIEMTLENYCYIHGKNMKYKSLNNIFEVFNVMKKWILERNNIQNDFYKKYSNLVKKGELHVYPHSRQNMKFIVEKQFIKSNVASRASSPNPIISRIKSIFNPKIKK
jgi:hypothetical protein